MPEAARGTGRILPPAGAALAPPAGVPSAEGVPSERDSQKLLPEVATKVKDYCQGMSLYQRPAAEPQPRLSEAKPGNGQHRLPRISLPLNPGYAYLTGHGALVAGIHV
jgi:hypothetical protein